MNNQPTSTSTPSTRTPGRRRGVAVGVTGGLLAGTAAGLVFGVPGLTSAASSDVTATPAAVVQQVDEPATDAPAEERPEMGTQLRESLQALVDAGTITAEQADAVTAHLVENRAERGEGREGRRGGPGAFAGGVASEALSDLLGLDTQDLRQQLRDGATLADIATAQGVEVQAVVDELVAELDERLTNAVENGRIDQAEADEKLADAEARITDRVNNGRPERGGADAPAPDAPAPDAED